MVDEKIFNLEGDFQWIFIRLLWMDHRFWKCHRSETHKHYFSQNKSVSNFIRKSNFFYCLFTYFYCEWTSQIILLNAQATHILISAVNHIILIYFDVKINYFHYSVLSSHERMEREHFYSSLRQQIGHLNKAY